MKRREFIKFLGGAVAWPITARAQQPKMPAVGFVNSGSAATSPTLAFFRQGLKEAGFVDGENVTIEYRWAEGRYDRLPAIAADLLGRGVAVLVATGGVQTALAAKQATTTIPIVFINGSDPVSFGLVPSLNRPGGNITGVSFFTTLLEGKRLGLLHELVPAAVRIGVLMNPSNPNAERQARAIQDAARALALQITIATATGENQFDQAFEQLVQQKAGALLVAADPYFFGRRERLIALAARHALPAIYEWREFVEGGGLASYGTNLSESYRQGGLYVARILKGEKPVDLPVIQATKFEFVINLKTAKAVGLDISPTLSARADEVIE